MRVPLSIFAEFVGATPSSKTATIERFRAGDQPYDVRTDYYKQLREFIPKNHRESGSAQDLLRFAANVTSRKSANYQSRAGVYARWWGNREVRWLGGRGRPWRSGDLEVSVSSEVVASFAGTRHAVKLHFKKERLAQERANTILRLLQLAYPGGVAVVLDLGHELVFESSPDLGALDLYLSGEAASFHAMAGDA